MTDTLKACNAAHDAAYRALTTAITAYEAHCRVLYETGADDVIYHAAQRLLESMVRARAEIGSV
jgi:hypothetical protein